jgi:Flagellar biosynthesis/type III secretory pathway lipoprotein
VLILIGVAVVLVRRRRARKAAEDAAIEDTDPLESFGIPDEAPEEPDVPDHVLHDEATATMARIPSDPDDYMRSEVNALADEDPDAVAERLREWLGARK